MSTSSVLLKEQTRESTTIRYYTLIWILVCMQILQHYSVYNRQYMFRLVDCMRVHVHGTSAGNDGLSVTPSRRDVRINKSTFTSPTPSHPAIGPAVIALTTNPRVGTGSCNLKTLSKSLLHQVTKCCHTIMF